LASKAIEFGEKKRKIRANLNLRLLLARNSERHIAADPVLGADSRRLQAARTSDEETAHRPETLKAAGYDG